MKLNSKTVSSLSYEGALDDFNTSEIGIVHFGAGAFHRAHQAVYTHDILAKHGGDWRILGVSLQSTSTANALNEQDCIYSLVIRGEAKTDIRLIKSIKKIEAAARGTDEIFKALASPTTRIVSMTVTEKAYGILREEGTVDDTHESIAHDLENPDYPKGILGMIVKGLKLRWQTGLKPYTVLCCDNLPQNGDLVKNGTLDFARRIGEPQLAEWIEEQGAFPNSMVDRITPAATPDLINEVQDRLGLADTMPIVTEPFSQWVVEDVFCDGRPSWEEAGVLFVEDVEPYEHMKLRMLNGTHSLIAYLGFLKGHQHVCDVMADANLLPIVEAHLEAASKTLHPLPEIKFSDYAKSLVERFKNSNILHETYQIAMDGSQKMPQRIFEPCVSALEAGAPINSFALATASWIRFCKGCDANGNSYKLRDPREAELLNAYEIGKADAVKITQAFHAIPELFPKELVMSSEWQECVVNELQKLLSP